MTLTLDDLQDAPYNPREITSQALGALEVSLQEFGDVSGIVWNKRNGYLVTGHQRVKVLKESGAVLDAATMTLRTPQGETFPVRVVDWPEDRHKAAMLAANSAYLAGDWQQDALDKVIQELQASSIAPFMQSLQLTSLLAPPPPIFKEYDVDIAQACKMSTCPKCGYEYPI